MIKKHRKVCRVLNYIDHSLIGISTLFLTAIWLSHDQLWAIIEGQPHSPDVNHFVLHFRPKFCA